MSDLTYDPMEYLRWLANKDLTAAPYVAWAADRIELLEAALAVKDNHDHFDCSAAMARKDARIDALTEANEELRRQYRRRGAYIRWMRWIARRDRLAAADAGGGDDG